MAQPILDGKGGSLITNHAESSGTYFECRQTHEGLIAWAKDVAARCAR